MRYNSIKFKISILYTSILGIILIIYSSFLYFSLHVTLYNEIDAELYQKVEIIRETFKNYLKILETDKNSIILALKKTIRLDRFYTNKIKITEIDKKWLLQIDKLDLRADFINIINSKNESIITSKNLSPTFLNLLMKKVSMLSKKKKPFKNVKYKKRKLRVVSSEFYKANNEIYTIQICTSLKPVINILENRQIAIMISIPFILLITSFLGRLFAKRILKPVEIITTTAKSITHHDLNSRIKHEDVEEEMGYLVQAFNEMINRLDKSFKYIAEFSSHVAHELKTPLAIIRGECELALRKNRTNEEYKRVININLEEFERMIKTIDDLLLLTKLDYRPEIFKFKKININLFIKEIYEQCKILGMKKNIKVISNITDEDLFINADKIHLRRLFYNIIQNAIKFNKINGEVNISLEKDNSNLKVTISDTGIGILEDDIPKVFDRFYHVEREDEVNDPGNGLGLSISKSIALIHKGDILLSSQLGIGSSFTIIIPLVI